MQIGSRAVRIKKRKGYCACPTPYARIASLWVGGWLFPRALHYLLVAYIGRSGRFRTAAV